MNKTRIGAIFMASTMLFASCTTSYQASSGVRGAMIGARVGETVGFLTGRGHFRGDNAALGSLIGMGVGAALGVGIAATIEKNERQAYESPYQRDDYQQNSSSYNNQSYTPSLQSNLVNITDVSYTDGNGDGYVSKGETIEIEGYITNKTNSPLSELVIFLDTDNQKDFVVSPSLTTTLLPNQRIRYTGRIYCKKTRRTSQLKVILNASLGNQTQNNETLIIPTR